MTKRPRPSPPKPSGWSQSERFREIGRAAITAYNAMRPALPKCGAKRRNGEACQNIALKNGRCRLHGGRVPKGDAWHRLTYPADKDPTVAEQKYRRKGRDQEKRAKRREAIVARKTPERQRDYERWKESHQPGPAASRARSARKRKADRDAAELIKRLLSEPAAPSSAAEVRNLAKPADAMQREHEAETLTGGIFD